MSVTPEYSTTIVTALYNIGRDKLTGKEAHRSFTKYLNWFKHLLWMNAPMVIFIPYELRSYVIENRPPQYPTRIIIRKFEDLSAYRYHDPIQHTIDKMVQEPNSDGNIPEYFHNCPEFITAKYETIIFSKFDFLKEVASANPFNTEYFIWLDAGTFYQDPPFNYNLPWPDPYKIRTLRDKFLISDFCFDIQNTKPLADKREYLRRNQNEICAFALGGTRKAIDRVHSQFWHEVENALNMGVINNEQHILQLMALEHPEYYYSWYRTRYQYPQIPVPLRDRMIPAELALGTFMGENYPINPNIKVLTIATREIVESSYERWETTARHYGYNYEILGRKEKWTGFGTKIRIFHEAVKSVTEPYVLLTDCTDLFFCGSSDELYHKFITNYISQNKDTVVGGEINLYYPGGKHDPSVIQTYFQNIKESPQALPNSGFIIGKTEQVLRLLTLHIDYKDDQVACIDTIYEGKFPLFIDYKTELVGNVPNYKANNSKSVGYFEYDSTLNRYKNKLHGTLPVVLHFPGKNWQVMQEFYTTTQSELVPKSSTTNAGWVLLGILILLIIIVVVAYFASR